MRMQHNGEGQKPTVLVIEDDPAVRSSLKFSLEIEGFAVQDFRTGHDLLGMGDVPGSNCIVVDYNLPDMTGLEVLGGLRDRSVSVPAILITSDPNQNLRDRAAAVGAGVVEKPLLGDALIESIRDIVAR
jgi:two-component system, LuxR family, response regulator FixJ